MGNIAPGSWMQRATVAAAILVALQRLNRRNIVGVLMWALFHGLVRLPIEIIIRTVLRLKPLRFSWRAAAMIDATRHAFASMPMPLVRHWLNVHSDLKCRLAGVPTSPAVPRDSTLAATMDGSVWFGEESPAGSGPMHVLMYIHGGGFCVGNSRMWPMAWKRMLAEARRAKVPFRILSVEYPLSCAAGGPTADANHATRDEEYGAQGFPGAISAAVAAFDFLVQEQGIPAHRIAFAGDSAGGNLCMTASIVLRDRARQAGKSSPQELRDAMPAALGLISPGSDFSNSSFWANAPPRDGVHDDFLTVESMRDFHNHYLANSRNEARLRLARGERGWTTGGIAFPKVAAASDNAVPAAAMSCDQPEQITDLHPMLSPIHADLRSLPPCHISSGGREVLAKDIDALAEALRAQGVEVSELKWETGVHNYVLMDEAFGDDSMKGLDALTAFLLKAVTAGDQAQQ